MTAVSAALLVVEISLRRGREHLHVDAGRIHVAQAARDIEAAGRERPIEHARRRPARRTRRRSGVMVTGTLGAALRSRAAVSWVRMWVWVSMVRSLLISSPENSAWRRKPGAPECRRRAADASPCRSALHSAINGAPQHGRRTPMNATSPPRSKREPRVEDDALVRGAGHFVGRPAAAESGLCRLRALAACPCPRAVGEYRGGARRQTGAGRAHRRGHEGGRRRQRGATSAGGRPRRRQDGDAVPPRARGRQGDAWRRTGGDGGRGNARRSAGRRRPRAGGLRGIAGGRRPRGDEAGRTAAFSGRARQSLRRLAGAGGQTRENERDVDEIIAGAAHVARVTVTNQRLVVASMETRGATGVYDAEPRATRSMPARRAPIACATNGAAIMGMPTRSCASSPKTSAAPSA